MGFPYVSCGLDWAMTASDSEVIELSAIVMKVWTIFIVLCFVGRDSKHYNRLRQTEMELSSAPMMDNQLDGGDLDDMHS